jgi:hypothetical protein
MMSRTRNVLFHGPLHFLWSPNSVLVPRLGTLLLVLLAALISAGCGASAQAVRGQSSNPSALTLSGTLPTGIASQTYNAVLSVSGGSAPYHFAVKSGTLPPGLTLNPTTGSISGTPVSAGSNSFEVIVTDATLRDEGAQRFAVRIDSKNSIGVSVSPASVTMVAKQTQQFMATVSNTANTAVTWSASAGLIDAQGLYTAPSVIPQTNVTITATAKADPAIKAHAVVTLENNTIQPSQPPTIANTSLPQGQVGSSYSSPLTASGGTQPYSWSISTGAPPAGITLTSDGQLAGVPGSAGTASFTVSVKDAAGLSAQRGFSLDIVSGGNAGQTTTCGPPTDPNYSCFSTSTAPVALPNPIPSWGANSCDNTSPYSLQNCGNLTGAGTVLTPSDFNRPIARLTDANTLSSISATPWKITFGTADNGEVNLFAPDDSWIIIRQSNQTRYLMAFNPATMAGAYSGITYVNQTVIADHTLNSTVYEIGGPQKSQVYQDTLPIPLASCAPSCRQPAGSNHVLLYDFHNSSCLTNAYAGNPNWTTTNWTGMFTDTLDDTTFTIAFADQNTSAKGSYVASWKKSYGVNGGCDLWNTATGAILVHDGTHLTSSTPDLFYNHEAFSALNNNYAVVSTGGQTQMINGTYRPGFYIWQIGTSSVVHCGVAGGPYCDGHEANGYLNLVAGGHNSIHNYASPNASAPATQAIPTNTCNDNHASWNHDDTSDSFPVMNSFQEMGSIYNLLGGATPPCAYYDEIVFAQMDGSQIVRRAAHTFNSGWHWNFETQNSVGVESSSGKFAMWPSDGWGQFGSTNSTETASCNVGGPDWHKSDSAHFTATAGAFGNYIMPQNGGNSGNYIYQVFNCAANGGSGACATGPTEPNFGSAQNSGQYVTEAAPGNITWVNTGNVNNCRSDVLIVKLFD